MCIHINTNGLCGQQFSVRVGNLFAKNDLDVYHIIQAM